jgi:SnoaL-like domain
VTTTRSREQAIDELLIKQEISDVMMRYCRGVNRLDMDLVRSCFHPDGWENHGGFKGNAMTFVDGLGAGLRYFKSTFHFIGNQLVEIQGNRAAHEAYFIGVHRLAPSEGQGERDVLFGGRYLGVFESRDGGPWLIAERTVVHDWSRFDPVAGAWPGSDPFRPGEASPADLVFHLLEGSMRA